MWGPGESHLSWRGERRERHVPTRSGRPSPVTWAGRGWGYDIPCLGVGCVRPSSAESHSRAP